MEIFFSLLGLGELDNRLKAEIGADSGSFRISGISHVSLPFSGYLLLFPCGIKNRWGGKK
jgi:hypothetical protein